MKQFKAALIQISHGGSKEANLEKLRLKITEAAGKGAHLVVLPELHNTEYFCQTENAECFDLAEAVPGPSTEYFGRISAELGVVIVCSLFEKRAPGLYHNTAAVIEKDGKLAGVYRKMHIPDDPGFYEKFYFTPGDLGFKPIETSAGTLGVLICWDQWYPEAARLMAMAGSDVLIYPTAIGWNPDDNDDEKLRQLDAWSISQRAHAVANGIPVIAVNRTGHEKDPSGITSGIKFWGGSFAAGAQGEIISKADETECIIYADIDKSRTEEVRRIWPFFRDRRIDSFSAVTERYIK